MTSQSEERDAAPDAEEPAAAASADAPPRRRPQERGLRRVEAILSATASLLCEEGVAGVTMHKVARRSGTTTGSMYHFFPDRDALLKRLVERHRASLRELLARVEQEGSGGWEELTTDQAVGRFLEPLQEYLDRHPDLVPLSRLARPQSEGDRDPELNRLWLGLAESVVASRDRSASAADVTLRAVTMTAMTEGVITSVPRSAVPTAELRRELRRAIVAYLDSYAPRAPSSDSGPSSPREGG